MYKKISLTLLPILKKCQLKFHVKLTDEEGGESTFSKAFNDEYIHMEVDSFITFEIKDGEWDKSKSIIINTRNIHQVIKGFDTLIENIYKKDTFEIVNGKTTISQESVTENTVDVLVGSSQMLRMSPAVIYDMQEDNFYEGAVLFFNKGSNYVELHYSLIEAIAYNLKKVDFHVYSNMLMRIYLDYIKNGTVPPKSIKFTRDVFSGEETEATEETKGTMFQRKSPTLDDVF